MSKRLEEIAARAKAATQNPVYGDRMTESDHELCRHAASDLQYLLAALKDAMGCLEFYAEKCNWVSRSGKMGVCLIDTDDRENFGRDYPWAGGKRARACLARLREGGEG